MKTNDRFSRSIHNATYDITFYHVFIEAYGEAHEDAYYKEFFNQVGMGTPAPEARFAALDYAKDYAHDVAVSLVRNRNEDINRYASDCASIWRRD